MAVLNFQPQTSLRFQIGRLCLFLDPPFSAIWCCSTFTNMLNIKYELQISLSFCFSAVTFITNLRCYMLLYFHRTAACAALFFFFYVTSVWQHTRRWFSGYLWPLCSSQSCRLQPPLQDMCAWHKHFLSLLHFFLKLLALHFHIHSGFVRGA